jgi:hypothetical protein
VKKDGKSTDFTGRKLVSLRDAQEAVAAGATRIMIAEKGVVTPSARDFLQQRNVALESSGNQGVRSRFRLRMRMKALPR